MSMGEFARDSKGYWALFTRTFGMDSEDPDDAIMSVHADLHEMSKKDCELAVEVSGWRSEPLEGCVRRGSTR